MKNQQPILIKRSKLRNKAVINLPASKSISNRVLIINALSDTPSTLNNLSEARDTQTMIELLNSSSSVWDVKDAGTTMRFLSAFAVATNRNATITGTERMQQRPIGILVDALRELGGDITYKNSEGFPPITINLFTQTQNQISIKGNVSSQYISALLLIAPRLPKGLILQLEGTISSRPYIEMTLDIMTLFGVKHTWVNNIISIEHQPIHPKPFTIEPDWSAASYWYSFVALSESGSVFIPGLAVNSLQGDKALIDFMETLGVQSNFINGGLMLTKCAHDLAIELDFTHFPDLAQTVAVICAAKGIAGQFTGLESLKIKETDRVLALQNELKKIGAKLVAESNYWTLIPALELPSSASFCTYDDHRMAMAFAPLCLVMNVEFDEKTVVKKSYPRFWEDLNSAIVKQL